MISSPQHSSSLTPVKGSLENYNPFHKILHWTIAVLVIGLLILGSLLDDVPKHMAETAYTIHKSFGVLVLVLMVIRLAWRATHRVPNLPLAISPLEKGLAHFSYFLWYVLLIAMPISGFIESQAAGYPPTFFGLFTFPTWIAKNEETAKLFANIHYWLAWIIFGLLIIHVLAPVKHRVFDKINLWKRML